jgi:hypothetical protein
MKTFTPFIVEGSIFTCSRSAMAGIVGTIPASILSAALRHSSPVFHRSCHTGLSGAAMNFCMPGLTSVGTGIDFAGSSRGASAASSALAPSGAAASNATVSASETAAVTGRKDGWWRPVTSARQRGTPWPCCFRVTLILPSFCSWE